ncbi:MAG: DUF2586 domain-containing protein [Plesiomonas shigelloides]
MVWPDVTITQLNSYGGVTKEIERTLLFVGKAPDAKLDTAAVAVTPDTDLDALLGKGDSELKANVSAFFLNAGQKAFCYVAVTPDPTNPAKEGKNQKSAPEPAWVSIVRQVQSIASVEGVILVDPVREQSAIQAAQSLRIELNNTLRRWVWFSLSVGGLQEGETWAAYVTRLTALQKTIAAPQVMLVPAIFGCDLGALAGRLCNSAVTVADSPARVATGPLYGLKTIEKPTDNANEPLDLATLKALARARYSVPMWHVDFDGIYWADGVTLEVEGGDYDVIEHVRVADKVARKIRIMAIPKIANRALNSSPASIAAHEMQFSRPLRDMSKSIDINGTAFPGEVRPPKDKDVSITWLSQTSVNIAFIVRPYSCPKEISVGILLDREELN